MSNEKKLKFIGPHGPMIASSNYDFCKVLDYLKVKYKLIPMSEIPTPPSWEIVEFKPMELPKGIDEWFKFMYGSKKDDKI